MKKTIKIADEIFSQFCLAYKNRNLNELLGLCSSNINMWGTGLDEYRVGLKEVELQVTRDWSQAEKSEIKILSFLPISQGNLWSAALCQANITVHQQEYIFDHLRGSIILNKEQGKWKILHMHASFPDMRNPENTSFPLNNLDLSTGNSL